MGIYASLGISATGMSAQRLRMDTIASNLANADSTNGVGDAYRRKAVTMTAAPGGPGFALPRPTGSVSGEGDLHGVAVTGIVEDTSPLRRIFEPGHPLAVEQVAPAPRLQADPPAEYAAFAAEQRRVTSTYGWLDRDAGVVRLPVERALEIVLEEGLPARKEGDQAR